jgi:hypothetical protein
MEGCINQYNGVDYDNQNNQCKENTSFREESIQAIQNSLVSA